MPTIQGRVIEICPAQSGVSRNGKEWKKQGFVIETPGNYPAKVYLSLFGADRIANNLPSVDTDVTVEFDIESREYNGRWYTDVNAWKVTKAQGGNDRNQGAAGRTPIGVKPITDFPYADKADVPF